MIVEGIIADGTLDEILNRWIGNDLPHFNDIPTFQLTGENGTLRVADTGNFAPLSYFDNNVLVGFDMDMVYRFAQFMGMDVEIMILDYGEIPAYVAVGYADMSAATFAVTDERQDFMIFGKPSLITQAVLIINK